MHHWQVCVCSSPPPIYLYLCLYLYLYLHLYLYLVGISTLIFTPEQLGEQPDAPPAGTPPPVCESIDIHEHPPPRVQGPLPEELDGELAAEVVPEMEGPFSRFFGSLFGADAAVPNQLPPTLRAAIEVRRLEDYASEHDHLALGQAAPPPLRLAHSAVDLSQITFASSTATKARRDKRDFSERSQLSAIGSDSRHSAISSKESTELGGKRREGPPLFKRDEPSFGAAGQHPPPVPRLAISRSSVSAFAHRTIDI
ncbi:hypothetical protein T492DRAFT_309844 [Pavlovales sp. CCMP2436]|nr:hypothetical protein T492DRAFT_309844 [Pavlovales sp. CCMP2436]